MSIEYYNTIMQNAFVLFLLLLWKHLMFDFVFQTEYMLRSKGKYFHVGGINHSLLHIVATYLILIIWNVSSASNYILYGGIHLKGVPISFSSIVLLVLCEFIVHYHTDYFKAKLSIRNNLTPIGDNRKIFWALTGFDQWVHNTTYLCIVWYVIS